MNASPPSTFHIDTDVCAGHGRCYSLAPAWFDSDDVGYAVVVAGDLDPDAREAMSRIASACPEGAIQVRPTGSA